MCGIVFAVFKKSIILIHKYFNLIKKLINFGGNLVELAKIKGILVNDECFSDIKLKSKFIKIELINRKEFIMNPESEEWELHDMNDEILIEFPDSDTAVTHFMMYQQIWEDALARF